MLRCFKIKTLGKDKILQDIKSVEDGYGSFIVAIWILLNGVFG